MPSVRRPYRNMGLDLVHSDYVMFLDDDDTLEPDHLMMLSKMVDRSGKKITFCNFKIIEEDRAWDVSRTVDQGIGYFRRDQKGMSSS